MSTQIQIENTRLSYCYAIKGKLNDRDQRVYSTTCLIPKNHPQVEAIKKAIAAAKTAGAAKLGQGAIKNPLLDGDAKDDDGNWKYKGDENRGHYLLRAANYNRAPAVLDADKNRIIDPDILHSGCWANVVINFYAYTSAQNKGISPGLEAIQKRRKEGERLSGGGVNADEVFGVEADDDSDGFLN